MLLAGGGDSCSQAEWGGQRGPLRPQQTVSKGKRLAGCTQAAMRDLRDRLGLLAIAYCLLSSSPTAAF